MGFRSRPQTGSGRLQMPEAGIGILTGTMSGPELHKALIGLIDADRVLMGPASEKAYDCDAYTVDKSLPTAVVLPESTAEVSRIIAWCSQNEIPFIPRGAGTGLSGGSLAALGGVVISTKRMTAILEIDIENRRMLAQAGAVNSRLTAAVKEQGLHFAPDPSSQTVATLGGNIALNSGGPHTLKYGVTAQHILGATFVAFDGEVVEVGGGAADPPGIDLLTLLVGSEGTLGMVTEAWIKLTPLPQAVETVLAAFPSTRHATETVAAIIAEGIVPAALEMMDRRILDAVKAAFGLDIPEGTQAMLLIECDGEPSQTAAEMARVESLCQDHLAISVARAKDDGERAKLWTARKKGVGAMGRIAPTIVTHDGVIPRSKLPDMLDYAYGVADEAGVMLANIFHAGDGNLHPIFCFDDREPGMIDKVVEAGEKIMERCVALGGSVTGEHGVGVEKLSMLRMMFDEGDMKLQEAARDSFHHSSLFNPCKIIPSQKGCVEHMRRWRGAAS